MYHLKEQAILWRETGLRNLEVMHATYLTHAFAPHRHASFVSSVIDQGVGTIWYRGATHIAPAGSLVLLNPDEIHTGEVYGSQGWVYRALYPDMDLLVHMTDAITENARNVYFVSTPILSDPVLAHLMQRFHVALTEENSLLERETLLLYAYSHLLTHYAERPFTMRPAGKEPLAVNIVREYLKAHFADDHNTSLTQLAQVTGLSPFYLTRVFRQAMGLPPHAYLNQIRLERAKQLLFAGRPVAAVAYETGFTDQSHLTRRFKQVYGVTPGHVLSQRKNVQDGVHNLQVSLDSKYI